MTVWTISAEKGSGGLEIATRLAAVTDLPLLDRRELSLRANDPDLGLSEIDAMEEQLAHRLSRFEVALAVAAVAFVPVSAPSDLAADSRLRRTFAARAVPLGNAMGTLKPRRGESTDARAGVTKSRDSGA